MSMVKQPFFGLRGQHLSWAVTFCSGSAFLLFGYDQGIMGSIISTPYFLNAIQISLDDAETISTIVSIYDVGCMVGCLVAAIAGTRLGRKQVITIGLSIMVVGAILQTTSYSVAQLIVGRIVAGFGNGMNTGTVPTWVSEVSKAGSRGRMVATQLSIAAFGIVIAYWMNYGFFHLHGQVVWRFPVAFQIAFAIVSLAILPWMPESPRFLLSKERYEEADQVLSALADALVDDSGVQADKRAILEAIALEDARGKFSFKSVIWDQSGQKITLRIILAMAIQMLQEMPGVNMVFYYSSTIFLQLGIVDETALVLGGVASIAFWLGSVAAIPLIEKIGRKKLLISGSIPMLIGYCIYTPMIKNRGTTELWIAFGATCVFCAACGWSWLSVPWVYGAELLPVRYRHIGGALNAFTNWTFTFIIVKTGPVGLANIGWRLYIVYIAFTFIGIPAVWFLYPETQGLTLEQIDGVFIKDGTVSFEAIDHKTDSSANEKGSMSVETKHVDKC